MTKFATTADALKSARVIYLVTMEGQEQAVYVGDCDLRDFHKLTDAHHNSEWKRIVKSYIPINIEILSVHHSEVDAATAKLVAILKNNPYCNVKGTAVLSRSDKDRGVIANISNGERYSTPAALARAIGVTPQAVAKHLKGDITWLKGEKYERITVTDPEADK